MADILSQQKIDALLEIVNDDTNRDTLIDTLLEIVDDDTNIDECSTTKEILNQKHITLYDFKRPNLITKEQLRFFRSIHDTFCRNIVNDISLQLRSITDIQLHSIDQMTYGEYLMSLPSPTSFNVFEMSPLKGQNVLEINPSILFPVIDRLTGGAGEGYDSNREFSIIENNITLKFKNLFMKQLENAWKPIIETNNKITNVESSPNIIQIIAQNEIVVMVVLELIIGHTHGMINICYPVSNLFPILDDLKLTKQLSKQSTKFILNKEQQYMLINKITLKKFLEQNLFSEDETNNLLKLPFEVKTKPSFYSIQQIETSLKNNVIEVKHCANDPLILYIGNIPVAEGEVVIVDRNYGLQITNKLDFDTVQKMNNEFSNPNMIKVDIVIAKEDNNGLTLNEIKLLQRGSIIEFKEVPAGTKSIINFNDEPTYDCNILVFEQNLAGSIISNIKE